MKFEEDKLFSMDELSDVIAQTNFQLHLRNETGTIPDTKYLINAYGLIADTICEEERGYQDTAWPAVLYNYRLYLELLYKNKILDLTYTQKTGHDLIKLHESLTQCNHQISPADMNFLKEVSDFFMLIDPNSTTLRYQDLLVKSKFFDETIDNPSKFEKLNLTYLKCVMDRVSEILCTSDLL